MSFGIKEGREGESMSSNLKGAEVNFIKIAPGRSENVEIYWPYRQELILEEDCSQRTSLIAQTNDRCKTQELTFSTYNN